MAKKLSPGNTPVSPQNQLLAELPALEHGRLLPHLEPVSLALGSALYESDGAQGYVYFPVTGIVSLLYVMEDASSAEIAVVGNEGGCRHRLVHGRRNHAESCRGAGRGAVFST